MVTEVSGFQMAGGNEFGSYYDTKQASVQLRPRASYDGLRGFKEGQAIITFGETVVDCAIFYSNPGFAKAMRVTRFMTLPPPDETIMKHANAITKLRDLMVNKTWTAIRADVAVETSNEIAALHDGFTENNKPSVDPVDAGIAALVHIHALNNDIPEANTTTTETSSTTPVPEDISEPAETPEPTEKPPAQSTETKKPSIFGAKPAEADDEAEETKEEEKPTEKTAKETPAKPSIFSAPSSKDSETEEPPEEKTATPKAAPTETEKPKDKSDPPNKPSIFGAKPSENSETEEPPKDASTPKTAPAKTKKTKDKSDPPNKPAIFGAKPKADDDKESDD